MSTDLGDVIKKHFGEMKMLFVPTAPNHILW
jgi:hypothetical protein